MILPGSSHNHTAPIDFCPGQAICCSQQSRCYTRTNSVDCYSRIHSDIDYHRWVHILQMRNNCKLCLFPRQKVPKIESNCMQTVMWGQRDYHNFFLFSMQSHFSYDRPCKSMKQEKANVITIPWPIEFVQNEKVKPWQQLQ